MNKKSFGAAMLLIGLAVLVVLSFVGGCSNPQIPPNNTKNYPEVYGIEVYYCEGLGYTYDYRMNYTSGQMEEYCRLSEEIECEAWAFAGGTCHPELNLCSREGYTPKIGVEIKNNITQKYPICIFPDGTYCKEIDFFNHKCGRDWGN